MTADTRIVAGRAARLHGESLEAELDTYHLRLAAQGVAWVRRVGTPVKVLGPVSSDPRGRRYFRAAFDGVQGCDFQGFTSDGRHVVIEAKTHAGAGSWDSGAVTPVQMAELLAAESAGCVALVILRAWGRYFCATASDIERHQKERGRRTVRPGEGFGRSLVCVQWLEVAK